MRDDIPKPEIDRAYLERLEANIAETRRWEAEAEEARKAAGLPERRARGGHYGRGFRAARIEPH